MHKFWCELGITLRSPPLSTTKGLNLESSPTAIEHSFRRLYEKIGTLGCFGRVSE